ncbi:MAG TPA: PaaI family thioesterase [Myxococcota bacterium]|jgi:uncharacterized protein (TIGR00369 family)|nr:PaaI family thioesterase [Myxococcota bacterium]HND32312.1 PaaI family thioesterase [Myxococcota bacterium]HNH49015.1 PaaI family thioesterase [Myxococcota bacterium]
MSDPLDLSNYLNANADGWVTHTGLRFTRATRDEVVAELEVRPQHLQAYGIVHGGIYSGIVETLASVGASVDAFHQGRLAVGLENHTSFLHAVRGGLLRAVGRPLSRGRRSQVWEVGIEDATGRTVATGRVRLLCFDSESDPSGIKFRLPDG